MKTNKMILTLSLSLIAICSFARKPPASVQKAFEQKFPGSTTVIWIKETADVWEADFKINGKESSADFTVEGTWVDTEKTIEIADLPMDVRTALVKINPNWVVDEVNEIETLNEGIVYTIDISKGVFKQVVSFKEDGTPVI